MIKRKHKIFTTACLVLLVHTVTAQPFKYSAALDSVSKPGFYQVMVTPDLSAHLTTGFTDLRITDAQHNQVPYIIRSLLPLFNQTVFNEFPVLSAGRNDSGNSILIIQNKGLPLSVKNVPVKMISQLVLFIKNTAALRYASLSGSNDQKQWYSITEQVLLSKKYQGSGNYFVSELGFEPVDYAFLKLEIRNEKSDPLNIIKAGSYTSLTFQGLMPLTQNPSPQVIQKDSSDKHSYITITQNEPYQTDNIKITVSGAPFYKRNAALYLSNGDLSASWAAAVFTLSSATGNTFAVKKFKAKQFYIVIDNKDNPPLKISSVGTSQEPFGVIAYLEKDRQYTLQMDNETAAAPEYDLAVFKDSIAANVPVIQTGPIVQNTITTPAAKNTANRWWLWPAIIAAVLVLALLTFRLLADMKKNNV